MGEAGLFLGMSIVRDRSKMLLWLHQNVVVATPR
jgi:hypothetical protein